MAMLRMTDERIFECSSSVSKIQIDQPAFFI